MSLLKERLAYLLEAYTSQKATALEEQELLEWMQEAQEDSELKAYVRNLWDQRQLSADSSHVNWDGMFDRITGSDKVLSIVPDPGIKRIRWPRMAAAAAILILIGSGIYYLTGPGRTSSPVAKTGQETPNNDVAPPASNKATLTLANGKVIILDRAGMGSLAELGAANTSKTNETELVYGATTETAVEYHTLNIPKGSKPMQLQLADGSEVWLNTASSITFPNVFTGGERKVSITGEAYFEVAKDAGKKFLVDANGTTTEVLGTHFNINAYANEPAVKITLLEGSVKVSNRNGSATIKPGQQVRLTGNGQLAASNSVNLDEVMAWKNGLFEFSETDIQTIMRQIERWYDVEIVFEGTVTQHFNGTIQRQMNASKVLNMLEKTGGVRFSIEGKKVIVKKY